MGAVDLFDGNAKRVLALAQQEAVRFHHGSLESEHFLIALIREGSSPASRVLQASGLEVSTVRERVERFNPRGNPDQQLDEIVMSAEAKKIVELAAEEAKQLGSERVAPDHVLLAFTREPGKAEAILAEFGLSPDAVRQRISAGRST